MKKRDLKYLAYLLESDGVDKEILVVDADQNIYGRVVSFREGYAGFFGQWPPAIELVIETT